MDLMASGPQLSEIGGLPEGAVRRARTRRQLRDQELAELDAEMEHARLNEARVVIGESIDDVPILVEVIFPVVADESPHVVIWDC